MSCPPPSVLAARGGVAKELVRSAISMARRAGRFLGNLPFCNGEATDGPLKLDNK